METNVLHCGDNLMIMQGMDDECVDLIYADPPFNTNRDWGEFDDRFRDMDHYIGWMSERIVEMRRLLKPTGSLYLHCDAHASHYIKVAMDNIFGVKNFNSDIIWRRCGSKGNAKMYGNSVDNILFYSKKRKDTIFNKQYTPYSEKTLEMFKHNDNDGNGSYKFSDVSAPINCADDDYASDNIGAPINGNFYDLGYGEKCPQNGYRWTEQTMRQKIADGIIIIKPGLVPRQKRYTSDAKGVPLNNIWTDVAGTQYGLEPETGRWFGTAGMILPGNSPKELVFKDRGLMTAPDGKRFVWSQATYDERIAANPYVIYWTSNGTPRKKHYADESKGVPLNNIWMDVEHIKSASYPTEKPPALLERIVLSSSNPGDIVLDPFCGSGTSLFAAHTLGRRYIGIDQNPRAIEISRSRLDVPVQQTL